MNNMLLNQILRKLSIVIPPRIRLPTEYYYRYLTGNLDQELHILGDITGNGEMAIDIGAYVGIWTFALSRHFPRVEAFEPIPIFADKIRAAKIKGVTVHNTALSSFTGEHHFHIPIRYGKQIYPRGRLDNIDGDQSVITVTVNTLDSYKFLKVAFIKIDVEGHEIEVLKGAQETIKREKPNMLIEIEQRHLSFRMNLVFEMLFDLGYKASFWHKGKFHPYEEFSIDAHQKPFDWIENKPKIYINKFLFSS